jgi:hypothetical protein
MNTLVFWTVDRQEPSGQVQAACREWIRLHPDCPVVAAPSGRVVAVQIGANRFSRERWERHVAATPELRELATCPALEGVQLAPTNQEKVQRETERKGFASRVFSFLTAVTGPHVADEVFARRLAACTANTCGKLKTDGEKRYCGACGCGKWRLAELSTKLRFARLECPQGIWTNDKLTTREIDDTQGDLHGEV